MPQPGETPSPIESTESVEPTEPTESAKPDEDMLLLTDPKTMRAMAHPLRLAILELFSVHETLTATQASEALGESPANCAFHLRTLGRYGLLEEAGGGRGRERPWKTVSNGIRVSSHDLQDKQAELAADALGRVTVDRWLARIKNTLGNQDWPAEWANGTDAHESILFLTPAETAAVNREIRAMLNRYIPRRDNPSLRPPGALPVEIDTFTFLRQDLAALVHEADADGPSNVRPPA
jgi:DNA-binding transcriptional ArsR family regulator